MLHPVATVGDLWRGEMRAVCVGGRKILLIHGDTGVVAYEDRCAHRGAELSRGRLVGHVLTCAVHEWQFDARTGAGINPASAHLARIRTEVRNEQILVDVP